MLGWVRLRRPSPGTVLGGLALIVAMGGVAVAAIPGGDGTVTACVSKDGEVRVIDAEAGATCKGSQLTVNLASTNADGKVADADQLDGNDSGDFLGRVITRRGPERELDTGGLGDSIALCGAGERVVGGGWEHTLGRTTAPEIAVNGPVLTIPGEPVSDIILIPDGESPVSTGEAVGSTGWGITVRATGEPVAFWAFALCAAAP